MNIQNCHFYPLFNACHQIQFQKNLDNRFSEKFKNVDFGPKNVPFNKNFPQKWSSSKKINEPILVLLTKGQKDGHR